MDGHGARAGMRDLLRLGGRMSVDYMRRRRDFDAGATTCRWARELLDRDGADGIELHMLGRHAELITTHETSAAILGGSPAAGGSTPGRLKTEGMRFLAPAALTIADRDAWAKLRPFNERVLGTGGAHPFAESFLAHVRDAFWKPVAARRDVQSAMASAMVGIVLGEPPRGEDPAHDVSVLFDVVQSPLRRKLLGFHYRRRRERLYALLARYWEQSTDESQTLLALARRVAPDIAREELLQQVPHWMFTFTGSGTDLLTRTLALIGARPAVRARAIDEITAAGAPTSAASVSRLDYLNACLLEAGRLFPPVTRTFHRMPRLDGDAPPARGEAGNGDAHGDVVHWFPLLQRDDRLGEDVHAFRPERWLAPDPDPAAAASNLFLRGPRACPGRELILFVCSAAIARQLGEHGLACRSARLGRDPLPVSFPEREARFTISEVLR